MGSATRTRAFEIFPMFHSDKPPHHSSSKRLEASRYHRDKNRVLLEVTAAVTTAVTFTLSGMKEERERREEQEWKKRLHVRRTDSCV